MSVLSGIGYTLLDYGARAAAGTVGSAAGNALANALFGEDDNQQQQQQQPAAPQVPTQSSRSNDEAELRYLESQVPKGEGFITGVAVQPARQKTTENQSLIQALYKNVLTSPPATPKLVNEAIQVSGASAISSGRNTKALQKLLKT
tara:strand:- start:9803 stop:10240 length:438 start_codon:yes stop_codon:yes gene_type:complete